MTRLQAVNLITGRLGQRMTPQAGLTAHILLELEMEQIELENGPIRPWFLTKESTLTSAGPFAYPTDFLSELTDTPLVWRAGAPPVPLIKGNSGHLATTEAASTGTPTTFVTLEQIHLIPAPDALNQNFKLFYIARQPFPTTDNGTNAWLTHAPKLLIGRAGYQVAKFLRSPESMGLFQLDIAEATDTLNRLNVAREVSGGFREFGG